MKKLMIAAAIVCAAAISQGASIDWQLTGKNKLKAEDGSGWNNKTIYLVLDSQKDSIIAALNKGVSFESLTLDNAQTGSTAYMSEASIATSDSLVARSAGGDKYNYMLLMVDTTSDAGKTWYRFSGAETDYAYQAGEDDSILIQFVGADFQAVGWTQASGGPTPIPEPTSAMLLLLGIAGLALRRKQA